MTGIKHQPGLLDQIRNLDNSPSAKELGDGERRFAKSGGDLASAANQTYIDSGLKRLSDSSTITSPAKDFGSNTSAAHQKAMAQLAADPERGSELVAAIKFHWSGAADAALTNMTPQVAPGKFAIDRDSFEFTDPNVTPRSFLGRLFFGAKTLNNDEVQARLMMGQKVEIRRLVPKEDTSPNIDTSDSVYFLDRGRGVYGVNTPDSLVRYLNGNPQQHYTVD